MPAAAARLTFVGAGLPLGAPFGLGASTVETDPAEHPRMPAPKALVTEHSIECET